MPSLVHCKSNIYVADNMLLPAGAFSMCKAGCINGSWSKLGEGKKCKFSKKTKLIENRGKFINDAGILVICNRLHWFRGGME